ncbi:MAG: sulfite exporter TauE/SafE family protein [Bacteroidales bacterium]|nr:sulfite exporter TauE/SafE family protein [Bacteroidales bacterium]
MQFLTAFVLGLLTILDPCTLFTSITAIAYIDKEVSNKRKVLRSGLMFVLGKLCTYIALGIPFLLGAQTDGIQHIIERYGEPVLAVFMLLCGVVLLLSGHHHEHEHGISRWIEKADSKHSGLWAFVLGVVFAVAFCPHRLIYFITMIDMAVAMPLSVSWIMLVLFGLGTGLPIMLIAWAISYSAVGIGNLTHKLGVFEKWFRYICAGLFIALSVYLGIHAYNEHSSMHDSMHNDECIMHKMVH